MQGCGNILFTFAAFMLWYRTRRHSRKSGNPTPFPKSSKFKLFVAAIVISDAVIIIRAIYRVVELAQGWDGHLITTETYFYALDSAPMIICMVIWVIGHSGITLGRRMLRAESQEEMMVARTLL